MGRSKVPESPFFPTIPRLLHRIGHMVRAALGYALFRARRVGRGHSDALAADLNARLRGYPRNHNYRLDAGRLVPCFRLYERAVAVARRYPRPLESFLDIGCCRGYYVMDAARRLGCPVAVGIDVHEPFVSTAQDVSRRLGLARTAFHLATLDEVARQPEAYGGPFQTILLIGTYHYLFWGSELSPKAYHGHREILCRLAGLSTDRVVFSARLEVARLPARLRHKAAAFGSEPPYTRAGFAEAAREWFAIEQAGWLGRDPLLVMHRKGA